MEQFKVKIFIKANSKSNEFLGYNDEKKVFIVQIKAPAFEGKANQELLKFLKSLKINAKMIQGFKSHFKMLLVDKTEKAVSLFVP